MVHTTPKGEMKESAVRDIIVKSDPTWYEALELFPGPFGRVDSSVTEATAKHLTELAESFTSGSKRRRTTLEAASKYPNSVALMCQFLVCLLGANGKVQSEDFWRFFSPVLAKRAAALAPAEEPTALRRFAAHIASGEYALAMEEADKEPSLLPHALIVARLLPPQAYDSLLLRVGAAIRAGSSGASLTEAELKDPAVAALLFFYEALGKGSPPAISGNVLANWPAYVAVFSVIIRPCEQRSLMVGFLDALAQSLASEGDTFGAHLCYLLSGDRTLEAVDAPSSLVCLLGVEHRSPKNFGCLLEPLAIQLSEVYEYAIRHGDPDALCPTIQPFKLAHAVLLADVGLVDKARRYMTMVQAFVKAVPQNRLSDAFRSSMRELSDLLNPSPTLAVPAEAPKIGKMMGGLFRGIAESTGFVVKPTPPPALGGDDDLDGGTGYRGASGFAPLPGVGSFSAPAFQAMPGSMQQPLLAHQPPPVQQQQFAQPAPFQQPHQQALQPPMPPMGMQGGGGCGSFLGPPPMQPMAPMGGAAVGGMGAPQPLSTPGPAPYYATAPALGGASWNGGNDGPSEASAPPLRHNAMDEDPLLNAGKAVWSGMKGLFSAVKGDAKADQAAEKPANDFYHCKERGRWVQRGMEDAIDASQYDPMTGKLRAAEVTGAPPPPPPMGGGSMGGPPPIGCGPPPMGIGGPPMGCPPMGGGAPPMGSGIGAPLPFGGSLAQRPRAPFSGTAAPQGFGQALAGGVRSSPFG